MGTTVIGTTLHHPTRPWFRTAPTFSGLEQVGETITATAPTWGAAPAATVAYQWYSDGIELDGSTELAIAVPPIAANKELELRVTLTNSQGSTVRGYFTGVIADVDPDESPTLENRSTADDTTPTVRAVLPGTAAAGDTVYLRIDDTFDFSSATQQDYTLQAADISAGYYEWTLSAKAAGDTTYLQSKLNASDWSATLVIATLPLALTLSVTTSPEDTTPTIRAALTTGHIAGMTVRLEWDLDAQYGSVDGFMTRVLDGTDVSNGYHDFTIASPLADGLWNFRGNITTASETHTSEWSTVNGLVQAIVATGAPVIADQTMNFGRRNRGESGGRYPVNTGGAVSGSTPNTLTGTNASHWEVLSDGQIRTTSAGEDNLLASYTLTLTVYNSFGSDTATITLNTEADAIDVRDRDEFIAAIDHLVSAGTSGVYKLYLVEGVDISGAQILLQGKSFTGTLTDVNEGLHPIDDRASFDRDAAISWTGGRVEITCRTNRGASISSTVRLTGSSGYIFNGIKFTGIMPVPENKPQQGGSYDQLSIARSATYTAYAHVQVKDCLFSSHEGLANSHYYINGMTAETGAKVVVEDCDFDGIYYGVGIAAFDHAVVRRCGFQRQVLDGIPCRGENNAVASIVQRHIYNVTMFNPVTGDTFFAGLHRDAFQSGAHADRKPKWIYLYDMVAWNVAQGAYNDDYAAPWHVGRSYTVGMRAYHNGYLWMASGPTNAQEAGSSSKRGTAVAEPGVGAEWAAYWTQEVAFADPGGVTGDIYIGACFASTRASWGLKGTNGRVRIENSHVSWHMGLSGSPNVSRITAGGDGTTEWVNCIANEFADFSQGWQTVTQTNCATVDLDAAISDPDSYETNFEGTFSRGTYGPEADIDDSTAFNLRTTLAAVFAPKAGSSCEGKGFTVAIT